MYLGGWSLRKVGVLGINQRNVDYVLKYNKRSHYPLADDKLALKRLAQEAGIAVPELYASIRSFGELRSLKKTLAGLDEFVVKPAHGAGGEGVIVVVERKDDLFHRANGSTINESGIRYHITQILYGLFSLGGQSDSAMIEKRVRFAPLFEEITYQGVPDIRIVLLQGFPVMAMIRLPTRASNGRANLHQGAIGVGICIRTGRTLSGVRGNKICDKHPDTGNAISGRQIPEWDKLLTLASQCYDITGLGYLGVDIVLDRDLGPLILEVNARPGLNIQVANMNGLLPRLRKVEKEGDKSLAVEEKLKFSKMHFGVKTVEN